MRTFRLPSGPLGVLALILAGTVGLFLVFWLIATLWVVAVGAGVVGALVYGWRRIALAMESRFRPNKWRRLPAPKEQYHYQEPQRDRWQS
ncbi:MAG: hypothetical protein SFU83_00920 [Meiothermus sp.]|nr:hypothetical protein [Meiothermus sp.]